MPKLSAVIISYNEEQFIGRCLESLQGIADEIIVVDSFSTDRTEEICRNYNVRFIRHEFEGYRDQKNYALRFATHNKIISLDADEALSDELRESILAMKETWEFDGYLVNRKNYFCGKQIRFSHWYPDMQLRLFHNDHGKWGGFNIHEKFVLNNGSKTGWLKGDLLHWAFTSYDDHSEKMNLYSRIAAMEYHKAGMKANPLTPYVHLTWGFFRTYFIKGGFLDGRAGFRICSVYAKSAYRKYRLLRELNMNNKKEEFEFSRRSETVA
jgi:glycosyltransferase involved in cell wall biosynthesis